MSKIDLKRDASFYTSIFPSPPDWSAYFGNTNKLELEIGTGRPHYLFSRAKAAPDSNLIGIEWKGAFVKAAHKKIIRENITNVAALHGNAWLLAPAIFKPESLSNITINFPDPWWKKRHQKRRVVNDQFTSILCNLLESNGCIFLQTDVYAIFNEYAAILEDAGLVNVAGKGKSLKENPLHAQSHREKKCVDAGVPIYRSLFLKRVMQNSA